MKHKKKIYVSILVMLVLFLSCSSPAQNKDTAYVEKYKDSLFITVIKKKRLMAHDPVALLKPNRYYLDSAVFTVPNKIGFIKFEDVQMLQKGSYPFIKGGINMSSDSVRIDLSFDDYDDKIIRHSTWNGNYKIHWLN